MQTMTIGEVAHQAGVSRSAIRYYEAAGLLAAPSRSGSKRIFAPAVVDAIRVIRTARDLGFSLADIRTLLNGFSSDTAPAVRWRELARRKLTAVESLIQRATAMKSLLEKGLHCDCMTVQDCILYGCNPPVTIVRRHRPSVV